MAGARRGRRGGVRQAEGREAGPCFVREPRAGVPLGPREGAQRPVRGPGRGEGGPCPGFSVRREWGARRRHCSVQQGALLRAWGGVGWAGGALLAAHTSPIIKHYVQKAPGDFPEPRSSRRAPARPAEPMDLSAAAALCLWLLSACRPRDGLEAAAVLRAAGAGPAEGPGGGGGRTLAAAPGGSAAPAAAAPGPRAARRAAGFRNGSVVPHQFMMSLYRSLAGGAAAASASGPGRHGRADTITGFADQATQGTHASSAPVRAARSRAGPRSAPRRSGRAPSRPQVLGRRFAEARARTRCAWTAAGGAALRVPPRGARAPRSLGPREAEEGARRSGTASWSGRRPLLRRSNRGGGSRPLGDHTHWG